MLQNCRWSSFLSHRLGKHRCRERRLLGQHRLLRELHWCRFSCGGRRLNLHRWHSGCNRSMQLRMGRRMRSQRRYFVGLRLTHSSRQHSLLGHWIIQRLLRSKGSTPLDFSTLLLHQLGKVLVERVQFLQNLRRASAPCLAVIEPECSVMAVSGKTEDSRTHLQKEACLREN